MTQVPSPDAVEVVRSARARRVSVRVDRSTGRVRVTLPPRAAAGEVERALIRHRRWIAARLAEAAAVQEVVAARGQVISVWGEELELARDRRADACTAPLGCCTCPRTMPRWSVGCALARARSSRAAHRARCRAPGPPRHAHLDR